ncbi:hypothetical protein ACFCW2_05790 [Qipengyuania sp. DSG2-2]|uniref:hypothetical protein n=1 Tax=Qipengyuania sp. DGS2-2 TaxID=3349631 RepID=UPI0036D2A26A
MMATTQSGSQRSMFRRMASFLRWRLVPVRKAGRLRFIGPDRLRSPVAGGKTAASTQVERTGHAEGPLMPAELIAATRAYYEPRIPAPEKIPPGRPHVNLAWAEDYNAGNPLLQWVFRADVIDAAIDYFSGRCRLDGINLLYSPARPGGALSESQFWHRDYDDSRSFHAITYLNDVLDEDAGPFVFVDKADTRRISGSPIIRRIDDPTFEAELGDGQIHRFYGEAGSTVFVDPAACYHYGSRCQRERMAVFLTFNSDMPYTKPDRAVTDNAQAILEGAVALRPDLDEKVLARLVGLG